VTENNADDILNVSGMGQEIADLVIGYFNTLRSGGMPADLAWSAAAQYNEMIINGGIESSRTATAQAQFALASMQNFTEKIKAIVEGVPRAELENLGWQSDSGNGGV
jgi:hypothetical protein